MNNGLVTTLELGTAFGASTIVCTSVNAEPLLTALITFGVSVVTIVGGELIKFLVAYIQKKTSDLKKDENENKKED